MLLIEDNKLFRCDGQIVDSPPRPHCVGTVQPFQAQSKEDFCLSPFYSVINDYVCVSGKDSTVVFSMFSDSYKCGTVNDDGKNALMISLSEYRRLCRGQEPWKRIYKYYADPNNPLHVNIPNTNPFVKCLEQGIGVCLFEAGVPGLHSGESSYQRIYSYHN